MLTSNCWLDIEKMKIERNCDKWLQMCLRSLVAPGKQGPADFGCLNLYFGCLGRVGSGRIGSGGSGGRVGWVQHLGEKSIWGICIWKKVSIDNISKFWTWSNFWQKDARRKMLPIRGTTTTTITGSRRDLSYETDSGPKTKTDYLSRKSVQFLKRVLTKWIVSQAIFWEGPFYLDRKSSQSLKRFLLYES